MTNDPTESLNLILVDDDPVRSRAVETVLAESGFTILSVIPTAAGLLFQMAQHNPDVVIIALDSPDRDILESLTVASAHNPRPVVMFSASTDQDFIGQAIRAGVTAYQAEGISSERVEQAIEVAIAQFRTYSQLRQELNDTRQELADRKLIERAKGLVMTVHKVSEDEAFTTLRKLAMDRSQSLAETAREVIPILQRQAGQ